MAVVCHWRISVHCGIACKNWLNPLSNLACRLNVADWPIFRQKKTSNSIGMRPKNPLKCKSAATAVCCCCCWCYSSYYYYCCCSHWIHACFVCKMWNPVCYLYTFENCGPGARARARIARVRYGIIIKDVLKFICEHQIQHVENECCGAFRCLAHAKYRLSLHESGNQM